MQRPSGANPRCRENSTNTSGVANTVTPTTNANPHSPARNDNPAACNATNDDEHAVSTDTAGPRNPNTYANRPDTNDPA
ncbi:hypothetical protein NWFMUON74_36910 [Nocardia wallacei]|uniref:Uncharacterized protein n=1 Tax=Nocardia wallacei TaxID=480035 RepID=A0A7G1KPZ0_9NOCA|nr:hypothetical protein NWFMUON74_36910 [Nocardia wallacei]